MIYRRGVPPCAVYSISTASAPYGTHINTHLSEADRSAHVRDSQSCQAPYTKSTGGH